MNLENWLEHLPATPEPTLSESLRSWEITNPLSGASATSPPIKQRPDTEFEDTTSLLSDSSISDCTDIQSDACSTSYQNSPQDTPVRDIFNQLRVAKPPILCQPQAIGPVPNGVLSMRKCLTDGFGQRIIPRGLESRIRKSDPVAAEEIPQTAYDDGTHMSDADLEGLWSDLESIRLEARYCDMYEKDENAWGLDVVQPILQSALKGTRKLQVTNVQSQQIDPLLLPVLNGSSPRIGKKADYAFSFACRDHEVHNLYQRVSLGGHGYQISHTTDAFTKRTILFSGLEVNADDGGKKAALAQLSLWLTANLEQIQRLGKFVKGGSSVSFEELTLPTVGYTVIGHDWYTYIAYRMGSESHVVGPITSVLADTRSTYGILKVCDLMSRTKTYATEVFWPWIRDEILQPLAMHPSLDE
ncbi:hypothetical protein BDV25DRAFT_77883 [Aspergillus avenaceus]|uniref:PD-(D/E)XK nuclease-like domain-containing protein n=1 Tax=Aspergillus avenaceus TaxID=36643 RepID=A0A5N6U0C0_ASPAV|nr:hypothetical protein BDV25DRAFT_77883 [Aspergillus avenaceus]